MHRFQRFVRRRRRPLFGHALAQQFEEPLFRHRRRDQDALAEIAAHHHQSLQVRDVLDAFGDGGAAETVREVDGGLADRRIGRVGGAALDERMIDLELGKRQIAQAGERRIAGAEIVDGDGDPAHPQLGGDLLGERECRARSDPR